MKIETTLPDAPHDPIRFPPIERQVYDLFAGKFSKITHETMSGGVCLKAEGVEFSIELKKKGVRLAIMPLTDCKFGEANYPTTSLTYNTDVTDKVEAFCQAMRKIAELQERAKQIKVPDQKKLVKILNEQLGTKRVEISYWNDNLLSGLEVTFYAHPKGTAPADGVLLCINKDNKIEPFWNASTKRRKLHYGEPQLIEHVAGHNACHDVPSMQRKIADVEEFKKKADAFDVNASRDIVKLLEAKKQGDALLEEFHQIKGVTWPKSDA